MAKDLNLTLCFHRITAKPVIVQTSKPTFIPEYCILVKVDRFAFTANNLTYQTLAEHPHFRFYDIHPAPTSGGVSPQTHGIVPSWGFGNVVASNHPQVKVGERLYGCFAPTRYLLLPISKSDNTKYKITVERPYLPNSNRLYNDLMRTSLDPLYRPTPLSENLMLLYRPLFWSSYWCEDWLFCSEYRGGCSTILISAASSKTAFCFAFCVRKTDPSIQIIGLTSSSHVSFCKERLGGLYDAVLDYDSFHTTEVWRDAIQEAGARWIYVDVSGNTKLTERVHQAFIPMQSATLVASIQLGLASLGPGSVGYNWLIGAKGGVGGKQGTRRPWAHLPSVNTSPNSYGGGSGTDVMAIARQEATSRTSSSLSSTATPASPVSALGLPNSLTHLYPTPEPFYTPSWLAMRTSQFPPGELVEMLKEDWEELMRECQGGDTKKAWVDVSVTYGGSQGESIKEAYERILEGGGRVGPEKGYVWSMWEGAEEAGKLDVDVGKEEYVFNGKGECMPSCKCNA